MENHKSAYRNIYIHKTGSHVQRTDLTHGIALLSISHLFSGRNNDKWMCSLNDSLCTLPMCRLSIIFGVNFLPTNTDETSQKTTKKISLQNTIICESRCVAGTPNYIYSKRKRDIMCVFVITNVSQWNYLLFGVKTNV